VRTAHRNRRTVRPRPTHQSQATPACQKASLKLRVQLSGRALKDVDPDNMTPEQRHAASEYILAVERLEQEHGYTISFSGVENLKRALDK
jgi:hypothetical protein